MSSFSIITFPKFGFMRPKKIFSRLVLPAPLGPKSPIISPEFKLKLILSRICLLSKVNEIFSNLATGALFLNSLF